MSGYGSSHGGTSLTPVGSGRVTSGIGVAVRGRLLSARSMLKHRLVAI